MLLISWGTGPFSVGACPWSLCTAEIYKHTHSTPRLSSITALRERCEPPKTNASFCFLFPPQWLDTFFHGASQHPRTENKVMPAFLYCTRCHLKRATEERYENPAETWAFGSPLSTPWEWSALNSNEHPDSPDTKSTCQYNLASRQEVSCRLQPNTRLWICLLGFHYSVKGINQYFGKDTHLCSCWLE